MEEKDTCSLYPLIKLPLYNHFQLAARYLTYFFTASSGRGHGVHSPYVFNFIQQVLNDRTPYTAYAPIEERRRQLQTNTRQIEVEDFGAGSKVIRSNQRVIKDIAGSSLKPRKYAQLLYRMVRYYQPATVVELGTSLGITSAYLASANPSALVYTCEGSDAIATIAQETFSRLQLQNIRLLRGDFANTLPRLFTSVNQADFVFIDGNHRKVPTIDYFNRFLASAGPNTIFVLDDIHWSAEMEAAWQTIQQNTAVTLTIDLFFIGVVLINPDFKVKQHFTIRY